MANHQDSLNASSTSILGSIFLRGLYSPSAPVLLPTSVSSIGVIMLTLGAAWLVYQAVLALFQRSPLQTDAPPLWKQDDLPLIGALRFFTARTDMWLEAVAVRSREGSKTGNFSFFLGKRHVIGLGTSAEARTNFFDNRKMSLMQGTAELLTGLPLTQDDVDRFGKFFVNSMATMLSRDNFVRNLHLLTSDAREMCVGLLGKDLARRKNRGWEGREKSSDDQWRVMNPFDELYRLVYQMTIRTVGADEVAKDHALGDYTLDVFQTLEHRASIAKVYIPWLPAPGHYLRIWDGYRLYRVFSRIVKERARTGARHQDSFQFLIDSGASIKDITGFVINALFGGQVNTGINAAWLPIFLALDPEWKSRSIAEVEEVISRHRTSPDQKPTDILGSLTLDSWQTDFPIIDLCLRECIRLTILGCPIRKNTTGASVPINKQGEIIPDGSYVAYLVDLVHFNPDIYTNPLKFDPARFEPPRSEDKKVPYAFLGWGVGRHPCCKYSLKFLLISWWTAAEIIDTEAVGMRFAKLELTIIMAYFFTLFDFELAADIHGTPTTTPPPRPDRNGHFATKPRQPVYLRYRPRTDMW
ncbi:hypothetical protein M434DRAFT_13123 [Hypoxylon sp. CO27-5]|nr:hypothetical protein M434DRAFT_13123 [Hypoxylon sp. CO27-5]